MTDEKPAENPTLFEQTQKVVDALKAENDRAEALQKRKEEFESRQLLGGHTDAGVQPPKPVTESPRDYARRIYGMK